MAGLLNVCRGGLLAVAVFVSTVLPAQARPDARTMTCTQLQALLQREGAVTVTTGQNTYDRYVSGPGACTGTDIARGETVATSDTRQCQVAVCGKRVLSNSR